MAENHVHAKHHDHDEHTDLTFAIVTASSTRSLENDTAGAALEALIAEAGWTCVDRVVVDDDRPSLAEAIKRGCDELGVNVLLTCGGTGLSMRDVTPEATRDVADREVPGIAEAIRAFSMQITRRAMLSRAIAAQRGSTLIINFPGSERAARENWDAVADQLEHAVKMTAGGGH